MICHFSLDVMCHGYIDEKIQASGVSHAEIEVEFDRMLMLLDHLDPVRHVLTGHIVPSDYNSSVIHCFYNGIERREVQKALGGMIYNNSLLLAPSRIKRALIYMSQVIIRKCMALLSITGKILNVKTATGN